MGSGDTAGPIPAISVVEEAAIETSKWPGSGEKRDYGQPGNHQREMQRRRKERGMGLGFRIFGNAERTYWGGGRHKNKVIADDGPARLSRHGASKVSAALFPARSGCAPAYISDLNRICLHPQAAKAPMQQLQAVVQFQDAWHGGTWYLGTLSALKFRKVASRCGPQRTKRKIGDGSLARVLVNKNTFRTSIGGVPSECYYFFGPLGVQTRQLGGRIGPSHRALAVAQTATRRPMLKGKEPCCFRWTYGVLVQVTC